MLAQSLRLATPIALGALAGLLCERCGVVNIGIEGMMLTAACLGFIVALYTSNTWIGLAMAILVGCHGRRACHPGDTRQRRSDH